MLDQLRLSQINGEELPKIKANRADSLKDEFFKKFMDEKYPKGYEVKEIEKGYFHVITESRLFSRNNGQKLSRPAISMFNPQQFKTMVDNGAFRGKTTFILHNPELKDKKNPTTIDESAQDQSDSKSGDDVPQKSISSMNKAELIQFIELKSGEDVDPKTTNDVLRDMAEFHEAKSEYIELFEDEPAEDMTTDDIKMEIERVKGENQ